MNWIIALVIIVLIMIIAISIKFNKKVIAGVLIGVLLVGIFLIGKEIIFYYLDEISVSKNNDSGEKFIIDIRGHKTFYNGATMKFSCKYNEEEINSTISNQYKNVFYDELNKQIVIIEGNQIYTISFQKSEEFLGMSRYYYSLKRNEIDCEMELGEYKYASLAIPFPIANVKEKHISKEDIIDCIYSFDYLNSFYEHFSNVSIDKEAFNMNVDGYSVEIKPDGDSVSFNITS